MRSNRCSLLVMACLLLWALCATYGFVKNAVQIGLSFGYVDVFVDIVAKVNEHELSDKEAIEYLRNYYPAGSTLDSKSMISRITENARNLAIECIEKRGLIDDLKSDGNSKPKEADLARPSSGEGGVTSDEKTKPPTE